MEVEKILYVSGYWLIYFFLHSLFASFWMKDIVEKSTPGFGRYYRIFYNLFSAVGLFYMLYYLATTPSRFVFEKHEYWQFSGLALATWGIVFLKQSFKQYSMREFLGFQQSDNQTGQTFTTAGVLKYVRHPIYTGTLLVVLGFFLFNPKVLMLVTLICVFVYILIGIQLEERKLEREFGKQYEDYKKEVPMLIPRFKRPEG